MVPYFSSAARANDLYHWTLWLKAKRIYAWIVSDADETLSIDISEQWLRVGPLKTDSEILYSLQY